MECSECGDLNRDDARFCRGCGSALALRCRECDRELTADDRFCDSCGTPVTDGATVGPAAERPAFRKTVTVLFCDLVGSTAFGERVDAEASREVMGRYHAMGSEVIEANGGTVAKFIGDGVMATFGLPEVAEDDAERAVRTGLALQQSFGPIAQQVAAVHGVDLTLRVGINSGEVAVGADDADLVGDVLNTAARLEAACPPGELMVGDATWRLTRSTVDYETLDAIEVRGKSEPVQSHRAVRISGETDTSTPFVGRQAELDALDAALAQAAANDSATVVSLIGSPGVGKTRLTAEFVEQQIGTVRSFDLRLERSGATTFEPVAELVRRAAGLVGTPTDDEVRASIVGIVEPETETGQRLVDLLASFLGAAPAPSTEETFFAVRRLCEILATDTPLVLVIDDLQWAEPLFLDLVEHLAEWVGAPVLLILLARPEIREVRASLAEPGLRVDTVLAVEGLDVAATQQLADELLGAGTLPAELAERLPSSTDGNPLFVRELVRMLVDDGVVVEGPDGWELAVDVDAVEVPPTIQSLLASRVERMPDDERRIIEFASVVGTEFALGAVVDLAEGTPTAVSTVFERLRRKEIIESTGTYRGDEPVLRFNHVLLRDAAYRRLLKRTRAELHERAGEWTERTAAALTGDHGPAIAHHLEQAYGYRAELGAEDDETRALGEKAAALLHTSASQALGRDDLPAAGRYAMRALALLGSESTDRPSLLVLACEALLSSGDVAKVHPVLDELEAIEDLGMAAWAACFRGQLVTLTDPTHLSDVEASVERAAERLAAHGDHAGVAKARQVRAGALARLGRVGECEAELDRSLAAARQADDRRRISAVLASAPTAALWGPSPVAQAGGRCLDVVRLVRITEGSPAVEATSRRCQGVLEALRGRFDTARELLAESRAASEELGLRHGLMETELYCGLVELLAGDPVAAEPHLRAANEGLERAGIAADLGQATAHLARALMMQGRLDEAEPLADESAAIAGQNPQTALAAACARAEILSARERHEEAIAVATEAVERLAGFDIVVDLANAHATLARVLAAAGDTEGARRARAEAERNYERKGATIGVHEHPAVEGALASASDDARPTDFGPGEPLDELTDHGNDSVDLQRPLVRPNKAVLDILPAMEAFASRDAEAVARVVTDDIVVYDQRSIVASEFHGVDGFVEWATSWFDLGNADQRQELIAVRGDRLAMTRFRWEHIDGQVVDVFVVADIIDGRFHRLASFDEGDLEAAVDLLNEWWMQGEAAPYRDVIQVADAARRTIMGGDTEEAERVFADGFEFVDNRRLVGFGPTGPGKMSELLIDRAADADWTDVALTVDFPVVTSQGMVGRAVVFSSDDGESQLERHIVSVFIVQGGELVRLELFDDSDFDVALARFDELTSEPADAPVRLNTAVRTLQVQAAAILRGDLEALRATSAPDGEHVDHRAVGSGESDLETLGRSFALPTAPYSRWDVDCLAVRADRFCLAQATIGIEDFEIQTLAVAEVDIDGRVVRVHGYDVDDLDAAHEQLDNWWLGSEPDEVRSVMDAGIRYRAVVTGESAADMSTVVSDGFTMVDHRRLVPDSDREQLREWLDISNELAGRTSILTTDIPRCNAQGWVSTLHTERHGPTGEYELRGAMVFLAAEGRITRQEVFDGSDLDEAIARFDELTADAAGTRVRDNLASRTAHAVAADLTRGAVDDAMGRYRDDAVVLERRGLATTEQLDRDAWKFGMESLPDDLRWEETLLAVRGNRLCLMDGRIRTPDGFEVLFVTVVETDADCLVSRLASFDQEARHEAETLMTEWWAEGEAVPFAEVIALGLAARRAGDDNDAAALKAMFSDEFEVVDHRSIVGLGSLTRDEFLSSVQPVRSQTRRSLTVDVPRLSGEGMVAWTIHVEEADGIETEQREAQLMLTDGVTVTRTEIYDEKDLDRAIARFDELTAPASLTMGAPETLAVRVTKRIDDLVVGRKLDELEGIYREDVVHIDSRSTVQIRRRARAAVIEALASMVQIGLTAIDSIRLAVLGDRLLLRRLSFSVQNDTVIEMITVGEIDPDGRVIRQTLFDVDNVAEARDLLTDWWLEGEGAPFREVIEISRALGSARDDPDALAGLLADDFVRVDHTSVVSMPEMSGDEYRRYFEVGREIGASTFRLATHHPRLTTRGMVAHLAEVSTEGSGDEGYSWERISLVLVDDGRATRIEIFDPADLEAALARFDELAPTEDAD